MVVVPTDAIIRPLSRARRLALGWLRGAIGAALADAGVILGTVVLIGAATGSSDTSLFLFGAAVALPLLNPARWTREPALGSTFLGDLKPLLNRCWPTRSPRGPPSSWGSDRRQP
jgi:hypothetical protein